MVAALSEGFNGSVPISALTGSPPSKVTKYTLKITNHFPPLCLIYIINWNN